MSDGGVKIRPAGPADHDAIWAILRPVYRAGETYCIPRDITRDEALADWFAQPFTVFVAEIQDRVVGTSHVGANRPGGGSHVANASFATDPAARGRGVALALVRHAKTWATGMGFRAMQFNFVVSTNADAVHLWQKVGFEVVGRLPGAFLHPRHGPVDALVMFHVLTGENHEP
ncbi:GNAT family N-acetyltransferase [Paracoccus sp. R12_1]|jgi:ribosomal protein S18 acetylase RimI-like enzyme|uniref:GNAT family N-acetyltransferase n=1 Tax=unclassified Paracoccus (in: a-proteobacteria) TaxID=2688777 RepID=UPI000C0B5615|nr:MULTISPECIES: N-acetyltransferase [unclassified Paracoccus (in: a-proteobacteria)]MBO9454015.1 GNAT family N-acetyltransferase [Paracoccus sp. R12_2]MBO9485638.1 GNAT family N-acetyltransferase [Paracoccus sp. R12_1]PHQ68819.1 MAG: GNAT family N-acetyltransferase [Paracoccus sp. (in: a-proteobacteria)]